MNNNSKFSTAKKVKLFSVAAPIILLVFFSFSYIGKYSYEGYTPIVHTCSFYTTLGFNADSQYILVDYYVGLGVINWLILLSILAITILSVIAIIKFKSIVSNIICAVNVILSVFFAFIIFIEGKCVEVISNSSYITTLAYLPLIASSVAGVIYFILRLAFNRQFRADAGIEQDIMLIGTKNMGLFILYLLFVPLYINFWIYNVTNYLNEFNKFKKDPMTTFLLSIFIPFYSLYWVYTSAKNIDNISKEKGINSNLANVCLLLSIFIYFISPILMQLQINEIESVKTKVVAN
ncbi:MAG: hypothetical protein ACI4MQ_05675 [Candidatus Coproplasma sp.]